MQVAVIGTGYVGLVSGACLAAFGFCVTCVDKDQEKIEGLRQGILPIYEPGLEETVEQNFKEGRLSFTTDLKEAVAQADIVFIAVGTPSQQDSGYADLRYVFEAAEEIAGALEGYTVIVTKSTVPVGTGRRIDHLIRSLRPEAEFDMASNPEFLREGSAIEDFMRPDRLVIGTESERAQEMLRYLYRPLYLRETPIVFTNFETAELIKYAANGFLATKIAFINQMADLCESCGADIQTLATGIGLDKRIGEKFLHAGPGYGGSCFPKDVQALIHTADAFKAPVSIIEAVHQSNIVRKQAMVKKIVKAFKSDIKGKTVGVLGVTFKPRTDDMRESPSLDIIPGLQRMGARIQAYDPAGMEEARPLLPGVVWCKDAYMAMEGADAALILTEWNQFRALDLERVRKLLKEPFIIDLRNIYTLEEMSEADFKYVSIGRPTLKRGERSFLKNEYKQDTQ